MGENVHEYQRLLENFASDPQCDIMTLSEMADWWKLRAKAQWQSTNGHPTIVAPDGRGDLQPELVTGYGIDGFTCETLC
jgi:hypothetical protein